MKYWIPCHWSSINTPLLAILYLNTAPLHLSFQPWVPLFVKTQFPSTATSWHLVIFSASFSAVNFHGFKTRICWGCICTVSTSVKILVEELNSLIPQSFFIRLFFFFFLGMCSSDWLLSSSMILLENQLFYAPNLDHDTHCKLIFLSITQIRINIFLILRFYSNIRNWQNLYCILIKFAPIVYKILNFNYNFALTKKQ